VEVTSKRAGAKTQEEPTTETSCRNRGDDEKKKECLGEALESRDALEEVPAEADWLSVWKVWIADDPSAEEEPERKKGTRRRCTGEICRRPESGKPGNGATGEAEFETPNERRWQQVLERAVRPEGWHHDDRGRSSIQKKSGPERDGEAEGSRFRSPAGKPLTRVLSGVIGGVHVAIADPVA
jgi:hypothetical protein